MNDGVGIYKDRLCRDMIGFPIQPSLHQSHIDHQPSRYRVHDDPISEFLLPINHSYFILAIRHFSIPKS